MNFKDLYNQKNKAELINDLKKESFKRTTLSFYQYTKINNLEDLRDSLFLEWKNLEVLGRVYIASEGINAQISIPNHNIDLFNKNIENHHFLKNINFKKAVIEGLSFIKLVIKIKNEIVAYGIKNNEYDTKKTGKHLNYKEFNQAIDEGAIIVDVRNYYEGEIGKFEHAIIPDVTRSKELLPEIKKLLKSHKNDKILMYCTGGIRCEKASSYLMHNGFKDVNQLDGGIIKYAHDIKNNKAQSKFIGKNFVFDQRMGEQITDDIISNCHQCNNQCNMHTNCQNQSCHILFIQCNECENKYNGCCSKKCKNFIDLPKEEQKKIFKTGKIKFTAQLSDSIKPKLKICSNEN